jgi:hypothetical protein
MNRDIHWQKEKLLVEQVFDDPILFDSKVAMLNVKKKTQSVLN